MTSGAIPAGEVARKRVRPLDQGSSSAEPPGLGLDCQESLVRYLARSCRVPRDYVDTRSRRLLESRRFLHDLTLALRRP
jgi:hypothetical protein